MRALYMQLWHLLGSTARLVASATASRTSRAAESDISTGPMVAKVVRSGQEEVAAFCCRGPVRRSGFFTGKAAARYSKCMYSMP